MKVGQKSIVGWISKRIAKRSEPTVRKPIASPMRELDTEQLREVGGGNGPSQLPKLGW